MKSNIHGKNEKSVFIKSYAEFLLVEKAVKVIHQNKSAHLQISVLGKISEHHKVEEKKNSVAKDIIEAKCKSLFDFPIAFGMLTNPKIGNIFITGFLVGTFLQEVEKKTIGSLSTGPYGILRGLGIDRGRTTYYLKALQKGKYILILRGYANEINQFIDILDNLTKKN
tara:strand:- start:1750 stop:2253 length:504 start_codon:yes stop_codon:yes gene_type:complete